MSLLTTTRTRSLVLACALTGWVVACTEGDGNIPLAAMTSGSSIASSASSIASSASSEPSQSSGGANTTPTPGVSASSTAALPVTASASADPSSTGLAVSSSSGAPSASPTEDAVEGDAGASGNDAPDAAGAGSASPSNAPPDDGRGPRAPLEGDIEVLFDGSNFDAWEPVNGAGAVSWVRDSAEGTMQVTPTNANHIVTNQDHLHRDVFLHIEFWNPNDPSSQMGQERGNSGIYLQSRYEVQVLDSFGREPEIDGCGAIYKVSAPLVNACNPAEQWNQYEIDFTAPRFESGQKVANARFTVWLNEQLVQDDVEVPGPTQAGEPDEPDSAQPLYLQDHGDTVRYRNIWWIHR